MSIKICCWIIQTRTGLKTSLFVVRLENEHLNNVRKFRAFTSVPLTSNHHDRSNDDDDDDVDDETVD